MPRSTSKPRPDIIEIGPNGVFIDGKPYTPRVVKHGEQPPDDGLPYIQQDEPSLPRTLDGRFYVGQRVRLNPQGYESVPIKSAEQAQAALGTTITEIFGPMCTDVVDVYLVTLEGLDAYMITTEDIVPQTPPPVGHR